ncbi:hypothetical protein GCM10009854_19690 [Saccharopolyspora halophila]|uniref:Uncharacterized protein n=1 Tax=Saccharopolyspora halophila TaxID=405551 RepID=A0ABN3G2P3_9PSEU
MATPLAGLLFARVQLVRTLDEVASTLTPMRAVTGWLTFAMSGLGLIGMPGLYLRQVPESRDPRPDRVRPPGVPLPADQVLHLLHRDAPILR